MVHVLLGCVHKRALHIKYVSSTNSQMKWIKESRKKGRMEGGEKEDRRGERGKEEKEKEVYLTSSGDSASICYPYSNTLLKKCSLC